MKPSSYYSASKPICRLSDPAHPHKLFRRRSDDPFSICYSCKGEHLEGSRYYYYCATCNLEFHRGCHVYPFEIKHPFHPSHPLTLIGSTTKIPNLCNNQTSSDSEELILDHVDDHVSPSDGKYNKCKCCQRRLRSIYYHCSICNFNLNYKCSAKPPSLTISHRKSHDHTLTLLPKRLPMPCDACELSLDHNLDNVYACLPCSYMVHETCIYLPRVIKITRHSHRLSFKSSLPPRDYSCGVCRGTVDVNCGQYSCDKECQYAIHSKCATRNDVWDGKDLEEVPEEPDEDVKSFVRIDKETIQHFSHDHYLKVHMNNSSLHEDMKFCEGCCLPIISGALCSCMECDFHLHGTCACLPRKKDHPLHKHTLALIPRPYHIWSEDIPQGMFMCNGCGRRGCGFMYKCGEEGCEYQLDVRCASISDSSVHESHPHNHTLFVNLTNGVCMGCKSTNCSGQALECMQCKSFLGLKCATLPNVTHYKHDEHPLTLCYGEKGTENLHYWCELCESKIDASTWFYTCDICRITLHVTCLLGKDIYMKANHIIKRNGKEVKITRNNGNSRPICDECTLRCKHTLVFKWQDSYYGTLDCVGKARNMRKVKKYRRKAKLV